MTSKRANFLTRRAASAFQTESAKKAQAPLSEFICIWQENEVLDMVLGEFLDIGAVISHRRRSELCARKVVNFGPNDWTAMLRGLRRFSKSSRDRAYSIVVFASFSVIFCF
jgi:hypothetical protein